MGARPGSVARMLGFAARFAPKLFRRWYFPRVNKSLSNAYIGKVFEASLDVHDERLVVFSDHHKGKQDGADDFWRCEPAYCAALGYYLVEGYKLCVLGDAEELWECLPEEVMGEYEDVLALEQEFQQQPGRYFRCWGNHDFDWHDPTVVADHLGNQLPGVEVREGLKLTLTTAGEPLGHVFLVHGHQGTIDSDQLKNLSKRVVRDAYAPLQRLRNKPSTTPARDWRLRDAHSEAMYRWAARRSHSEKLLLIAGHTHEPVFSRPPATGDPEQVDQAAEASGGEGGAAASTHAAAWSRSEQEALKAKDKTRATPSLSYAEMDVPCYFNTGCCSFGDGSVSGLEIVDGKIRLVSWPWPWGKGTPVRVTLDEADLGEVFDSLPGAAPA